MINWVPVQKPTWLVVLSTGKRRGLPEKIDRKYVRATTREGAIRTARFHSYLPRRTVVICRHATPQELGCVPVGSGKLSW